MEGIVWKKWVGEYKDRLGAESKTHATFDGNKTECGRVVPQHEAVEGVSLLWVNCKKCRKIAEQYTAESREFDKANS